MSSKDYLEKYFRISPPSKPTILNPNAAEFVPSSFRSLPGSTSKPDASSVISPKTSGKVLDRSVSNVSNTSDDEACQYWCHQLPDDITPDFKVMDDVQQMQSDPSLSRLSIHNRNEVLAMSRASQLLEKRQAIPLHNDDAIKLNKNMGYSRLRCSGDQSSSVFSNLASNAWDRQFPSNDPHISDANIGDRNSIFSSDLVNDHTDENDTSIKSMEVLLSQFPDIATKRLAGFPDANEINLKTTIESLRQLKVDDDFGQLISSKTLSAPNLSALDFPAFAVPDLQSGFPKYTGKFLQPVSGTYQLADKDFPLLKSSPLGSSMGATSPVSAVHRVPSQDSGQWKYGRSGSAKFSVGSSRSTEFLSGSHNGNGRPIYTEKMQSLGAGYAIPWPRARDANGDMFSESREEANGALHNVYFDQAGEAFSAGRKDLANKLMERGQLYNMQIKAAHEKSRQSIHRQRNFLPTEIQAHSSIQDIIHVIDLQGFHPNEAMRALKNELGNLRRMARSTSRRFQVAILIGAHAKGSRTLAGLPIAIEQYLLEEGLLYTESQPGLLWVAIY